MPEQSVTAGERKRLFALMVVATEITNRDLHSRTGVMLEKVARERLNELKLVTSRRVGRGYVHELTDRGWVWCREQMSEPVPEGRDPYGRLLQALLSSLDQYFARSDLQLSDVFWPAEAPGRPRSVEVDVDELIRKAYQELVPGPGAALRLAALRRHLAGVVQADLDAALRRLNRASDVVIVPDSDQRSLTAQDRAAALRIGGEDKHLIMIEGS